MASAWPALTARVASASPLLLLLDYDGTLTAIAQHPSRAVLPPATKRLLVRLARQPGVRVALISGRALDDVRRMAGLRGVWYAGNHGLELQAGARCYVPPAARHGRPRLARVSSSLRRALRGVPGVWVEDKRLTASVHWRRVSPSAVARCRRLIAACLQPHSARKALRVTYGKRVVEIRPPVRWGKGEAVRWFRRQAVAAGRAERPVVVYAGDDATDESAFAAVNRVGGISIFVGESARASRARWRLKSPREVATLLERMLKARETRWKKPRAR